MHEELRTVEYSYVCSIYHSTVKPIEALDGPAVEGPLGYDTNPQKKKKRVAICPFPWLQSIAGWYYVRAPSLLPLASNPPLHCRGCMDDGMAWRTHALLPERDGRAQICKKEASPPTGICPRARSAGRRPPTVHHRIPSLVASPCG